MVIVVTSVQQLAREVMLAIAPCYLMKYGDGFDKIISDSFGLAQAFEDACKRQDATLEEPAIDGWDAKTWLSNHYPIGDGPLLREDTVETLLRSTSHEWQLAEYIKRTRPDLASVVDRVMYTQDESQPFDPAAWLTETYGDSIDVVLAAMVEESISGLIEHMASLDVSQETAVIKYVEKQRPDLKTAINKEWIPF